MKFKRDFFAGLAIVVVLLTIVLLLIMWWAGSTINKRATERTGYDVVETNYRIVLRDGIGLAVVFGLLSWRNAAGLKAERRHQEIMRALRAIHAQRARPNKLE